MMTAPAVTKNGTAGLVLTAVWLAQTGLLAAAAHGVTPPDLRHPAVIGSAAATVAWMAAAWGCLLWRRSGPARWAWTFGWLSLLLHLLAAFGIGHGWSHAAAVERIREVGGTGAGILVNYAFVLVWAADLAWWWIAPAGHARRPTGVAWAVHGFAVFMVVNGTVVFGPPGRRWAYAALLVALGGAWLYQRWLAPSQSHLPVQAVGETSAPGR